MKKSSIVISIILFVIFLDQGLKFWVKLNMTLHQEYSILGGWLRLNFVENEGMAFGLSFGGTLGKVVLSIVRLSAIILISYFLRNLLTQKTHPWLLFSLALILGGAVGNMIDNTFYGLIFSSSFHQVAQIFPDQGGYSTLLMGKVVDMLHIKVYEGILPYWIPKVGGQYYEFFRNVFNVADLAITMGVFTILFRFRTFFSNPLIEEKEPNQVESSSF